MHNFYKKTNIYSSTELQNIIADLEDKFEITHDLESFKKHVNFGQNISIPIHNWFKYREGYSYKLIDLLLEDANIKEDEFVIDPFCGSGTTLLQANIHNYGALGIDINPMSVTVSSSKSNSLYLDDTSVLNDTLSKLLECSRLTEVENIDEFLDLERYFDQDKLLALLQIEQSINRVTNSEEERSFFRLGFLSIIESVSNRKRDGNGLATRPTKVKCVFSFFHDKIQGMIADLISVQPKQPFTFKNCMIADNSENLAHHVREFQAQTRMKAGAIIFSPPYANSFDYFESYKLELRLGNYSDSIRGLNKFRSGAVRSFISDSSGRHIDSYHIAEKLAEEIEKSIPEKEQLTGKRDSRTRKVPRMIRTYFNDMANIIEQCSQSLDTGKKCYIVVDQSSYLGKIVPSDLLLADLAEQRGFKVEKLVVCRLAKTSPQQAKRFPYLKEALRESIIVLVKN